MEENQIDIIKILKGTGLVFVLMGIGALLYTRFVQDPDEVFTYLGYGFVVVGMIDYLVLPFFLERALEKHNRDNDVT